MTEEQITLLAIKGAISELSAAEQEAVRECVDHIKRVLHVAGSPVAEIAIALVGAEMQAADTKPTIHKGGA